MDNLKKINLYKKVQGLLDEGYNEIDIVDHMDDDLFDYLNLLESYYIYAKRYDEDRNVAEAKDLVDIDPELVKEELEKVEKVDSKDLLEFIKERLKLYTGSNA